MPESPEVQNVLNSLKKELKGHKIIKASITHPKLASGMDPEKFAQSLEGETFRGFERYGKYLIFVMDDLDWISHLRMEGKFIFCDPDLEDAKVSKHIHAVFELDDGRKLCYYDTRKFGRMQMYPKAEDFHTLPVFKKLGIDALDEKLNGEYLKKQFSKRKIPVKTALLDQHIIAGIGNIYADEILFASKIHPETPANELTLQQCSSIARNTREILKNAIESGGTTIRTFSYGNHQQGSYQNQLKVHDREGESCRVCQSPVEMIKIGGRSTYLCPECQKRKS